MADLRTSFPTLEDSATQAGAPLHKVLEGDAAAAKNASAGLVAKKASDGTLIYLKTDDAGAVYVTLDANGTLKRARGKVTPAAANTVTTVCDIALTADAVYKGLSWITSCFRDSVFEIVHINDPAGTPTETILADVLVGSGDLTDSGSLKEFTFTAGDTAPILRLRGFNTQVVSDLRGSITTLEDATTP